MRQLAIGGVIERQAAVQLQHKDPGIKLGQRFVGEFFKVGIHFAAERIGRHVVIVGSRP
ncbi:hypothetical protein D3C75_1272650 [compost metagenome]